MMKIHNLVQGSDPWHQFRFEHHGASEAAAVLGLSKTTTRNELMRMKHSGLAREFSDWVQRNVLDKGHELEAKARPHAEAFIADDLYAVTCSDGKLSASCDGLTLGGEIAWEHKQVNVELFAHVAASRVPEEHMPQCQQVLMVTGAGKLIFTVSDGTPERMVHAEVLPDAAWFERIRAGWAQFDIDLASGAPPERAAPAAVAAPVESLPAVLVRMSGALTVDSNLDAFGVALRAFIAKIPGRPTTDQEFADTDAACKALKKAEDALAAEEDRALAGMSDVEQMRRLVAELRSLARTTRLAREKMVEARKLEIRTEEVGRGKTALAEFVNGLNTALGKPYMPPSAAQADFALAIKGLRSLDSVRAAIDQKIADGKIAASAVQQRILANLNTLREHAEHGHLFPDVATLVLKTPEDLAAMIGSRIAEHQAKEAKRLEAERERIRAEEQAKAQREAAARQAAEDALVASIRANAARIEFDSSASIRKAINAFESGAKDFDGDPRPRIVETIATARQQMAARLATAMEREAAAQVAAPAPSPAKAIEAPLYAPLRVVATQPAQPAGSEPATLKLGTICERLGFTLTAAFVSESLGIQHSATDKAAKLFRESDWPRICSALVEHIGTVAELQAA